MCLHRQSSLGFLRGPHPSPPLSRSKVANQSTVGGASHVASLHSHFPSDTSVAWEGHVPPQVDIQRVIEPKLHLSFSWSLIFHYLEAHPAMASSLETRV